MSLFDKFPYFEYDHYGALRLPEDLLYLALKFSTAGSAVGFWGKPLGKQVQDFLRVNKRPMIWGDTEDGGMVIDPTVGNIEGNRITPEDVKQFQNQWSQGITFKQLYDSLPARLKFFYRSWDKKSACENAESDASNMVMGVDGDGNCVYWKWVEPASNWECAIDGTCFQSADPVRAIYSSESECRSKCGEGKWSCKRLSHVPRGSGHYCEPDANGNYNSVAACELGMCKAAEPATVVV